jgi:COMPASS component SWD3
LSVGTGTQLISASGDSSIKIWQLDSEQLAAIHTSNYSNTTNAIDNDDDTYSISSSIRTGAYESATTDSKQLSVAAIATLNGHSSDVYSVKYYPDECHVVSGSHDRTVKLWDISTTTEMKTFTGHDAGVLHVTTNNHGSLLISGSRDSTIKFWDVMSGVCVRTYNQVKHMIISFTCECIL